MVTGDPDLLIKIAKALLKPMVLYDALANEELLSMLLKKALKIFVEKKGCHAYSQDQINQLIVMRLTYGHVVRLKGGDPFILEEGVKK
jgi:uroporphyrin-III C-methyltransferase